MNMPLVMLLVLGIVQGSLDERQVLFSDWQQEHNKIYTDTIEFQQRFMIFNENLQLIEEMNTNQVGGPDVEFGLNQFADLTQKEFSRKILMNKATPQPFEQSRYLSKPDFKGPLSFDWRDHGAVTEVKDQGSAGSCWSFSTIGNIEGVSFLKTGKLVRLSEEQLVDCDGTQDAPLHRADCGVFGGWPYLAYQYIINNGGIDPEEVLSINTNQEYPYCVGGGTYSTSCFPCMAEGFTEDLCGPPPLFCDAVKWPCRKDRSQNAVTISDWAAISTSEEEIAQHLILQGPLSILMNASKLQFYRKGIFDPRLCDPTELDHAVLLVAYGETEKGQQFWTVKNSWGQKWGQKGYFQIARGKGRCGLNSIVVTAIV